jgi:hypothetical protein
VRFTASPIQFETKTSWQFDDLTSFEMINMVSSDGQGWKQVSALRPDLVGAEYKSLQASAVYDANDGNGTKNVSPTETWSVLSTVDFTGFSKAYLFFWNISQYKKGGDSDLRIKVSTDYVRNDADQTTAVSSATWTDITSGFVLDESLGYDSEWVWSIGALDVDQTKPNLTFAFVYTCSDTYTDVNVTNVNFRAATWKIGDVKVGGEQIPTSIGDKNDLPVQYFYPNPVLNILNVSSDVTWIEVFNLNGSKARSIPNSTNTLDVSDLSSGIYILRLSLKDGSAITTKLIKR